MLFSALLSTLTGPAHACGGLFCDTVQPVIQNAERIVFEVRPDDGEGGMVDAHVQIFYEGPSDEFAWIVPVPSEPELFLSTQAIFDNLATRSGPIFRLNTVEEGRCGGGGGFRAFGANEMAMGDSAAPSASPSGTVEIVSQGQVGPYDTLVLRAQSEDGLITFLQDSGYDLPSQLSDVLAPYISLNAHFVALKLSKDRDVGEIAPLGMSYAGNKAMIPIQLTSVAASDDMRLEVYVFSDRRAVPKSYLHVNINHAAVDWWNFGQNYPDVITQAADEAGGHAFATDYFGPSDLFAVEYHFSLVQLRAARDALAWIYEIRNQGVPMNEETANVILAHVAEPVGVDPVAFINCPECFGAWNVRDFDVNAATADLRDAVLEPLNASESLYDQPLLTRMTSSLSAVEMTVDPVFVLNADLSDEAHFVDQTRNADQVFECGTGRERFQSRRRLVLNDGREILLPSQEWFSENNTTELEFIEALGEQKAQVVEQLDETGQGEVLLDLTDDLSRLTDLHNDQVRQLLGCAGCTSTAGGAGGGLALLGLVGLATLRRRRS